MAIIKAPRCYGDNHGSKMKPLLRPLLMPFKKARECKCGREFYHGGDTNLPPTTVWCERCRLVSMYSRRTMTVQEVKAEGERLWKLKIEEEAR